MPVLAPPQARLDDGTIALRAFGPDDLGAFEAAARPGGNEGIWLIMQGGPGESLAAHIGWADPAGPALAVVRAVADVLVGVVYLTVRGTDSVELSYGVAPEHRGRGVATRAARLAAGWLLREAGWSRVELRIADDALASRRVAVKAGFRLAGRDSTWVPSTRRAFDDQLYLLERPPLELPDSLARDIQADAEHGAVRSAWLDGLPSVIDDLASRWSLRVGRPFQPGDAASWVAPARTAAGKLVVLKVGWRHEEAAHEAEGLRAWAGEGAVRLLGSLVTGSTSALLLEACEPGTPLSQALPPREQDAVVAGLLLRLWIEPPAGYPFRPLSSMCDRWASEFEQQYAAARSRGHDELDPGLARAGIELFRRLPATATRQVLLCTDLHHGNVLAAARQPWLAIDPKPYLGDPAYDPLQHMLNFPDRLAADPAGFARRMAGLLGLHPERLRHWLFARCVQESVGVPHLRAVAIRLAP